MSQQQNINNIQPDPVQSNPGPQGTRQKKSKKNQSSRNNSNTCFSLFQGKTDEIKDHVYNVGPKAKDMFMRTTGEIAEYIARSYKGGGEFINAMNPDNMGFTTLTEPPIRILPMSYL